MRIFPLSQNSQAGGLQLSVLLLSPLCAGDKCGGNFAYVGDGIKDCSGCLVPHGRGSYSYITKKFPELAELARKKDTK